MVKTFALAALLAVYAQAQDDTMTQEQLEEIFNNREDGMLISPNPKEGDGEMGSGGNPDKDIQEGIDFLQDVYNTFCASFDASDKDGDHEEMSWEEMNGLADLGVDEDNLTAMMEAQAAMEESTEWSEWDEFVKLHGDVCDAIKTIHEELNEWNNADAERKEEMQQQFAETVQDFFEDLMDGSVVTVLGAGAALSVALMAF